MQSGSLSIDDLGNKIDFAMAFALAHEVPDKDRLFSEIRRGLKHGGKFLLAEPRGHVSEDAFNSTVSTAQHSLEAVDYPTIKRTRAVLLRKR